MLSRWDCPTLIVPNKCKSLLCFCTRCEYVTGRSYFEVRSEVSHKLRDGLTKLSCSQDAVVILGDVHLPEARPTGHNSSSVETQTRCSKPLLPRCTFAIYPPSISRHCGRTAGPRRDAADPVPSPALELDDMRWFTLPLRPFSHFRFLPLAQSGNWSGCLAGRHAQGVRT
ncbi:hypothetical protein HBI81_004910 [Parastagonospora nodorum]|nr:hypothetical protein HBH50_148270 [Parastagonospora nodorum]KAH4089452.1 hypothetical protein HBH48_113370 [Parastagonospora nodorum]KAH4610735.1 hypothetical protein HBH82_048890 [Parastagonospora nodorum]KAH4683496.1 hypothetical protein HBH78_125250 [Parastagonospora nodorum]KAH4711951.1 hypothetical protein HBH67_015730 [Parastagonospora nodorum]